MAEAIQAVGELGMETCVVNLVEPGYGPSTAFTKNTGSRLEGLIPEPYAPLAQRIFATLGQGTAAVTTEQDVARGRLARRERHFGSAPLPRRPPTPPWRARASSTSSTTSSTRRCTWTGSFA